MKEIILSFKNDKTQTINQLLLSKGFSSSNIYQEILSQNVKIGEKIVEGKNEIIQKDEMVYVKLNHEESDLPLNDEKIDIVYEDDYILIVNKPIGLLSEPYKLGTNNNLASMIANYFNKENIASKVHLINRLDKVTSGLILVAKNRYIKNLFAKTKIIKKYLAIVEGKTNKQGEITIKIDKDSFSNVRKIGEKGKLSKTKYRTISYDKENDYSLVEIELLTGRTHQIRLSFSSINHPLVGDKDYGSKRNGKISLCAHSISFEHPILNNKKLIILK